MIDTNQLNFKHKKLFYGNKKTGFETIKDGDMWRVKYPDGILSKDSYNLTRVKEQCVKEYTRVENDTIRDLQT